MGIRLYNFSKNAKPIKVCKHILIKGRETEANESSEYIESLYIYCDICKKEYSYDVFIN